MTDLKKLCLFENEEVMIADAMIFTGKPDKKVERRWKEVLLLTYLKFWKPINIFLLVEDAKKFERFIPFLSSDKVKWLISRKIQLQKGFSLA